MRKLFEIELEDDDKLEITKQNSQIDLFIEVKDKNNNYKKIIIIEDKTDTQEHDNQLKKYIESVIKNYKKVPSFEKAKLSVFYYKTGHLFKNPSFTKNLHYNKIDDNQYLSEQERIKKVEADTSIKVNILELDKIFKVIKEIIEESDPENIIINQYFEYLDHRRRNFISEELPSKDNPNNYIWAKILDDIITEVKKDKSFENSNIDIVANNFNGKHYNIQVLRLNYPWLEINSKLLNEKRLYIYNWRNESKKVKKESESNAEKLKKEYKDRYDAEYLNNNRKDESKNQLFKIEFANIDEVKDIRSLKDFFIDKIKEYIKFTK